MTGRDAIRAALESTKFLLDWYVGDFTDADLLVRPVPGANHIAWQIGNVIAGDKMLVRGQLPDAAYPDLPAGFEAAHGTAAAKADGPAGYLTKAEYLALFAKVRAATVAALDSVTDADLDRPTVGSMGAIAPTLGHLFLLVSNHTLLHAGQVTVVRRLLGKPVLF